MRSPSPGCPPSGRAAGARWPRALGADVDVCGVCGVCAVRVVVRGAAFLLSIWCSSLPCFGAVWCPPCAVCLPFPLPCARLLLGCWLPFVSFVASSLLPWVGPHALYFGRQLWGASQLCGVSLTTRGTASTSLQYDRLTPVAQVEGPRCWAGDPLLDLYRLACHPLLPWLPKSAWLSSYQQHWGTARAAGLMGRVGRPSVSHPWGVVCCYSSLGRPRCAYVGSVGGHLALIHLCARLMCSVCHVLGHLAPVQQCARSVCCVCGVLGHLAPIQRCSRSVCCVCGVFGHLVCKFCALCSAVSLATWLVFIGLPA